MDKYILSEEAFLDIREIWYYTIDKWSEKQAEYYVNNLYDQFDEIYKNPNAIEIFTPKFETNYKCKRYQRHLIFFRVLDNGTIDIIRILHDNMDLPQHLLD